MRRILVDCGRRDENFVPLAAPALGPARAAPSLRPGHALKGGATSVSVACLLLLGGLAWGQGAYKTEPAGPLDSPEVPKGLEAKLQPQGARLLGDKGAAVTEVWLLNSAAAGGSSGGSDAVYPSLGVGTLVGVIHFPVQGSDFRGQSIKPGYYTMRYARMPQDGNHMGVNPYPDFVLLSPAAADTDIDKSLKFEDLVKLSKQASGTGHPAVMSLVPVSQGAGFPSLVQDNQGRWVLQTKLGGQVPIALVVVGQAAPS
jgi:hypothetical protein